MYFPPLDYASKWKIIEDLPPPTDEKVATLWRQTISQGEIGYEWQPTKEFEDLFEQLQLAESAQTFLAQLDGAEVRAMLEYFYGEIQGLIRRQEKKKTAHDNNANSAVPWLARQMGVERPSYNPTTEADTSQRLYRLLKDVEAEIGKRKVDPEVWQEVMKLIERHETNTGFELPYLQKVMVARLCSDRTSELRKYADSQSVVNDKIKRWIETDRNELEKDEAAAHEAEVNDNLGLARHPKTELHLVGAQQASQLRQQATATKVEYLVCLDLISRYIQSDEGQAAPVTAIDPRHILLEHFIARPDGLGMNMKRYNELESEKVVGPSGKALKVGTIKGYYSEWKNGANWLTQELIDKIVSKLEAEGMPVDYSYIHSITIR